MKKKTVKKLVLAKETVRSLEENLKEAVGGEDWTTVSRYPVDCVEAYITQVC